jgi:hypothetical protein
MYFPVSNGEPVDTGVAMMHRSGRRQESACLADNGGDAAG